MRVFLTLIQGNFEQGFQVFLRIGEIGAPAHSEITAIGQLPPAPAALWEAFEDWRSDYLQWLRNGRIEPAPDQVTNSSELELQSTQQFNNSLNSDLFIQQLNGWLNSGTREWQSIRDLLLQNLNRNDDEIQVIIQTRDSRLRQLPWHLWNLFSVSYRNAEIALSLPESQPPPATTLPSPSQIRILAILGNTTGIDVNQDLVTLEEELPNATITPLENPTRANLYEELNKRWDIIFYAGHSNSQMGGTNGRIYINSSEYINLDQLENVLRSAIDNGLKLAIFNSCDGLGLAHRLATWHLPQSIVMRESVPDRVAQEFLKSFLREFAQRRSLYVAVREARRSLQSIEQEFPCASWLPVICQNPAARPFIWTEPPPIPPSPEPQPIPTRPEPNPVNKKLILFILPLIVVSGFLVFLNRDESNKRDRPTTTTESLTSAPTRSPGEERISLGEETLFSGTVRSNKREGMEAIKNGNYDDAIPSLVKARSDEPNDPETLIFLNNAKIEAKEQENYTIAVSVPIEIDPGSSKEMLRGVAQAQDEINQDRGINGVPLKVAIADDEDDPEIAKEVASALVNQPEVLGVIGPSASDVTLSAGEIYKEGKLVAISPVSSSTKLTGFDDYIFRTVPSDAVAAKALATYMLTSMQKKNAAVFYNCDNEYSRSLRDAFTTAIQASEGQVIHFDNCDNKYSRSLRDAFTTAIQASEGQVIHFDFSEPNFDAAKHVEQAIEQGAEVLMLAADTSVMDKAHKVIQENGKRLSLLGGDDVYSPETLKVGKDAEGMVIAVAWDINTNQVSDFISQSKKLWSNSEKSWREVNWRTALSYDAAKALIAALERNPTRQGIQRALSSSDFSATGATGNIKFESTGDRHDAPVQLVKIVPDQPQSNVYDFVPLD